MKQLATSRPVVPGLGVVLPTTACADHAESSAHDDGRGDAGYRDLTRQPDAMVTISGTQGVLANHSFELRALPVAHDQH